MNTIPNDMVFAFNIYDAPPGFGSLPLVNANSSIEEQDTSRGHIE